MNGLPDETRSQNSRSASHARFGKIARDKRGVDGADRNAGHPIRCDAGLGQALVDAGLVGAQRAAALQHEHGVIVLAPFFGQVQRLWLLRIGHRYRRVWRFSNIGQHYSATQQALPRQHMFHLHEGRTDMLAAPQLY